jgi:hypothetical protein
MRAYQNKAVKSSKVGTYFDLLSKFRRLKDLEKSPIFFEITKGQLNSK